MLNSILDFLREIIQFLISDPVTKVFGIIATVTTLGGLFLFLIRFLRQIFKRLTGRYLISQMNVVQQLQYNEEHTYLEHFIKWSLNTRWDPLHYVSPIVTVKESKVIRPYLLVLDSVIDQKAFSDSDLATMRDKEQSHRTKNLLSEVMRLKQVVILGDPGSGKTIALTQLGIDVANAGISSETVHPVLPIFLPLNEYTGWDLISGRPEPVIEYVRKQVSKIIQSDDEGILNRFDLMINQGRFLFLFDAIDEMPRTDYYPRFKALSKFMYEHINNQFVFSCRLLDYINDPDFSVSQIIISPFSEKQIKEFLNKYLGRHASGTFHSLFDNEHELAVEARSPFFLSLMASCVQANIPPGSSWDVLVKNYVSVTIETKASLRPGQHWTELRERLIHWLSYVAFELVRTRATGTKADHGMILQSLKDEKADEIVLELAQTCGLIRQISPSGDMRFSHHKLQEYFAALHLSEIIDKKEADLEPYLDDIWWQEVLVMAAGIVRDPDQLIDDILSSIPSRDDWRNYTQSREGFNLMMLAMRCFRPARNHLALSTRIRLTRQLIYYLERGNILQKVRSLRVAGELLTNDQEGKYLFDQIKRMLTEPSSWVRETALSTTINSSVPQFDKTGTIFQQMLRMTSSEALLVQGIRGVPTLWSFGRTRWFVPLYLFTALLAGLWAILGFLLVSAYIIYCYLHSIYTLSMSLYLVIGLLGLYGLNRAAVRRGIYRDGWYTKNLNQFCLTVLVIRLFADGINLLLGWLSSGTKAGANGNTLNLITVLDSLLVLLSIYLVYIGLRNAAKTLLVILKRNRETNLPSDQLVNVDIHERSQKAISILEIARNNPDPVSRMRLIDKVVPLIPLNEDVLNEIESFAEIEIDQEVATNLWKLYNEVDMSLQRNKHSS